MTDAPFFFCFFRFHLPVRQFFAHVHADIGMLRWSCTSGEFQRGRLKTSRTKRKVLSCPSGKSLRIVKLGRLGTLNA